MPGWWCCADRTIRPERWTRSGGRTVPEQGPRDTVVLLDEAYIEFVAPQHRIDGPNLVRRFPNVVVLRTFSKAYGLAGLRIGYGFARRNWPDAVDHAIAVRHRHHQLGRGRGVLRRRRPAATTHSANRRGAATTCACACGRWVFTPQTHTPTSCTCRRGSADGVRCSTEPGCRYAITPTAVCGSPSVEARPPKRCWPRWESRWQSVRADPIAPADLIVRSTAGQTPASAWDAV